MSTNSSRKSKKENMLKGKTRIQSLKERIDVAFETLRNIYDQSKLDKMKKTKEKQNIIKNEKKSKKENESIININHHWKKYFDSKYNQIFYNNPFTGESVWELPKGAKVEETNEPIEIITSNNNN